MMLYKTTGRFDDRAGRVSTLELAAPKRIHFVHRGGPGIR